MMKLIAALLFLASTAGFAAPATVMTADSQAVLLDGEILSEYTRTDEPGGAVRLQVLMRTDVEQLWQILAGCGKAFTFVDGLELCEIIEKSETYARIHQVTDPGILVPVQDYTYESQLVPYQRMDFKMVDGTMKAIDGSWEFIKVNEGVVVVYNLHVQPSLPVPRFLVRNSLRRNMRHMLACIRGLVDGSGSAAAREKDLKRCPGPV